MEKWTGALYSTWCSISVPTIAIFCPFTFQHHDSRLTIQGSIQGVLLPLTNALIKSLAQPTFWIIKLLWSPHSLAPITSTATPLSLVGLQDFFPFHFICQKSAQQRQVRVVGQTEPKEDSISCSISPRLQTIHFQWRRTVCGHHFLRKPAKTGSS